MLLSCYQLTAQVSVVGNRMLEMNINGSNLKIPYYANHYLDGAINEINSAIIVIHGANRNADDYYYTMRAAANMRPEASDSTFIFSPQFLTETDINAHSLDHEYLYWTSTGWKFGANSRNYASNPRPEVIPSYAVLDTVLLRLCQSCPNLKSIVVTGHSAGGQVVNRHAATSPMITILSEQYNIRIKVIVANPSSYVYHDNRRVISGTIDQFEAPDNSCTDFNEWGYGLDELYTYPARVGVDSIRSMYEKREVAYILGELDNDPNSSTLDVSCEAMLQGRFRLERGTIYFNHLLDMYGDELLNTQTIDTVPGVGHSSMGMYTSQIGLCHIFDLGTVIPCDCSNIGTGLSVTTDDPGFTIYPNPSSGFVTVRPEDNYFFAGFRIEVYSISGERKLVFNNQTEINLGSLPRGTYLIRIKTENLTKIEKIIVVN